MKRTVGWITYLSLVAAACMLAAGCSGEDPVEKCMEIETAEKFYEVTPNSKAFPLPYELPKIGGRPAEVFDWEKYIAAAQSDADRAFRARVAAWDFGHVVPGGGDSNSDEMIRGNLAAKEFRAKCDDLIRRYRLKLQEDEDALQVKLVGGSWGGSGARVAYANSRMNAYLNYHRNLVALGSSLHLQDLPE